MSMINNPLENLLGIQMKEEGAKFEIKNLPYILTGGILRQEKLVGGVQQEIADFYDVHWKEPGAYDNEASDRFQVDLFKSMFPGFEENVPKQTPDNALILDVGCGSGVAGRAYFRSVLDRVNYIGVDMSSAIDQAAIDFSLLGKSVGLLQAELNSLPFENETFDYVFCPGVLHYTLDMGEAIKNLSRLIKKDGRFVTWVYKRQKPVRHITDEYLRSQISLMSPRDAIEAVKPLTDLGIALGKIDQELEIPSDIPLLGVNKGKYNLQRFFYYHIMKLFYNPDLTYMRHVINNLNAYYPKHILFLSPEKIRKHVEEQSLRIEVWAEQGNGIGIVAVKK